MKKLTPDEMGQRKIVERVKSVLGDRYVDIEIQQMMIHEDLVSEITEVHCRLVLKEEIISVESSGDGLVDSLFKGIKDKLASRYCSFEEICFEDFTIDVDPTTRRNKVGTDVKVMVGVVVTNSRGARHHFNSSARSFNTASVRAVLKAIEYYLNCEAAVLLLKESIRDARRRNRPDLEMLYVRSLSDIVPNTSYVKTIEKWKERN
tara:strand:+ start:312 stop:926 length:615 start_codon:yes stop_codon:yes gene_type:complete